METSEAIRTRRTLKVLADPAQPFPVDDGALEPHLAELLELASWAPFHKPADDAHREGPLDSAVPWRFTVLPSSSCRSLVAWVDREGVQMGKMSHMLSAASACLVATWLPDPAEGLGFQEFEPTLRNMEHIAAASAAVQNLLLAGTDRGFETYWSTGGLFRTEKVYDKLEIPRVEVLLGSIFLFPSDTRGVPAFPGALRERRGGIESWSRVVRL